MLALVLVLAAMLVNVAPAVHALVQIFLSGMSIAATRHEKVTIKAEAGLCIGMLANGAGDIRSQYSFL
ncbi:MAG: hypothetical protein M3Z24_13010 [Chloroflexota bacterium]|nr:hypothetical protein [Chloroflexota bacterium]